MRRYVDDYINLQYILKILVMSKINNYMYI